MVCMRRMEEWNDENGRAEMGNSLAIRVPKRVANGAGLPEQDAVESEVRKGTLVVQPHLRRVYRLADLLKRPPRLYPPAFSNGGVQDLSLIGCRTTRSRSM